MYHRMMVSFAVLVLLAVHAETSSLQGVVLNKDGIPIENAIVTLMRQNIADTTGLDGKYAFTVTGMLRMPEMILQSHNILVRNGMVELSLRERSTVKIEVYGVKGNVVKRVMLKDVVSGVYQCNIAKNCPSTNVLIVNVIINGHHVIFPYMTLDRSNVSVHPLVCHFTSRSGGLAEQAAAIDTLSVTAVGFETKLVAVFSYDNQQQNITLDSSTSNGKNPPCPSGGCGKDLTDLKSGTYKITSAGLNREYIIDIPANYDKNTPYRLIFGMHMMGGDMNTVVSMKYYELKAYAEKDNVPIIFVSPEGNSDNTPWRVNDDKDHVFFSDMLKLFKEKLCVDTSRIFCCGFSYGAMITYSLSLDFQKELRAVACYAPANWNIWLPEYTPTPIAFYSTTGTDDGLCKYVNSDAKKQGGKYCVLQHLEDNECTAPATIPTATTSTHISTEFEGCREGYPVIFGSFNGGHSMSEKDPGSNVNWIAQETWDFFMRF